MALRPVCAWARGVGFGYFAGMVSVNKWSIYFHTPWGVHDHLRSLRTCAFTPLAAIVSQSHQPFKENKIREPPTPPILRRSQPSCGFDAHATSATESWTCLSELPWGWESLNIFPGAVTAAAPGRSPLPPPQGDFSKFHYESPVRTMSCRFDSRGRSRCCPRPPLGFVKRPPFKFRALMPK